MLIRFLFKSADNFQNIYINIYYAHEIFFKSVELYIYIYINFIYKVDSFIYINVCVCMYIYS